MNFRAVFYVVLVIGIAACSGGGSSGPSGGDIIDRSGRSIGTISAFGSVIVNGVTYAASTAVITVDDRVVSEAELAIGQVVVVEGLVDSSGTSGTAERITTDPVLRGVVQEIDLVNNTLRVLGITVNVVSSTVFEASLQPAGLAALQPGQSVEIFGYTGSSGEIAATRIAPTSDNESEVQGLVAELDANGQTFSLNGVPIDYTGAVLVDFVNNIENGNLVEVEGTLVNGTTLVADRVELELGSTFSAEDEDTEVELEGLVTSFVSAEDFSVNGVAVSTTPATEFEGGAPADIALNVRVEVEGVINAEGVLVADEIDFELESNLEVQGFVETKSDLASEITVLGIRITVTSETQLIDESDAELRFFSLSDIQPGDFTIVKAFSDGTSVVADFLKRTNPEDKSKLQGLVSAVVAPSIFVGEAEIVTSAQTDFEVNDTPVNSDDFFITVMVGDTLSAQGSSTTSGVLTADEVELED
jgi:uncharacterized protein DUF5666